MKLGEKDTQTLGLLKSRKNSRANGTQRIPFPEMMNNLKNVVANWNVERTLQSRTW
jgi:hypothetical protein